jgi:hypothetical protein
MDETEWLACTDAWAMIQWLATRGSDRKLRVTDRKIRLHLCACFRRAWDTLDEGRRNEVRVMERFADGQATAEELRAAVVVDPPGPGFHGRPVVPNPWDNDPGCVLLRDMVGPLPFRPVTIDPKWLSWNYGTIPAIARRIYDERAFHDLPILADALEDAGCTDQGILSHCRGDGPHARGCWVVDLILGRE